VHGLAAGNRDRTSEGGGLTHGTYPAELLGLPRSAEGDGRRAAAPRRERGERRGLGLQGGGCAVEEPRPGGRLPGHSGGDPGEQGRAGPGEGDGGGAEMNGIFAAEEPQEEPLIVQAPVLDLVRAELLAQLP